MLKSVQYKMWKYSKTPKIKERHDTMLYVGGSKTAYRCDCGANVFNKISPYEYECNGCHGIVTAEK